MKTINLISLVLFTMLICFSGASTINAQPIVTSADSTLYNLVQNDTTGLRKIAGLRLGDRIGAMAQNRIAFLAYKQKKESIAEREYLKTYNQYLNFPEAYEAAYYLGKIAMRKGRYSDTKKYLSEYLNSTSATGDGADWARYYVVKAMYKSGDTDYTNSVRQYLTNKKTSTFKKRRDIYYDYIRYLSDNGQIEDALVVANKMVSQYPGDSLSAKLQYLIGDLYIRLNRLEDAKNQYTMLQKTAAKGSEDGARAEYQIAVVYENQNDLIKARQIYIQVQKDYPAIERYVGSSRYSLVMLTYREAIQKQDSLEIIDAYKKTKEFVRLYPNARQTPRILMALANLCEENGKYDEALNVYQKVIDFDDTLIPLKPESAERSNDLKTHRRLVFQARIGKAQLWMSKFGDPEKAEQEYDVLLKENPGNEELNFNKAVCMMKQEAKIKKDGAKQLLNQIVMANGSFKTMASELLEKGGW